MQLKESMKNVMEVYQRKVGAFHRCVTQDVADLASIHPSDTGKGAERVYQEVQHSSERVNTTARGLYV